MGIKGGYIVVSNVEITGIGLLVANIPGIDGAADLNHTVYKLFKHAADNHSLAASVIAGHERADHTGSAHAADPAPATTTSTFRKTGSSF